METAIAEYSATESGLARMRAEYAGAAYEVATPAGMKLAIAARASCRGLRVDLERRRVEIKAPALELCRRIDAEAKRITAEIEALELPIDRQIRNEEHRREEAKRAAELAERQRVEAEQAAKRAAEEAERAAERKRLDDERAEIARQREALRVEREQYEATLCATAPVEDDEPPPPDESVWAEPATVPVSPPVREALTREERSPVTAAMRAEWADRGPVSPLRDELLSAARGVLYAIRALPKGRLQGLGGLESAVGILAGAIERAEGRS